MAIIDHSNMTDDDFVVDRCDLMGQTVDVLCVRCGWEGHVHNKVWLNKVFEYHKSIQREFSDHRVQTIYNLEGE